MLDASLKKVRDAAAYVGIISHLYGQVPETELNPNRLSLTELEFREARRLNRPILIFIMGTEHPVTVANVERDPGKIEKLDVLRQEVKHSADDSMVYRVYREFNDFHEFEVAVTQSMAELHRHLEARAQAVQSSSSRRPSYLRQVVRIAPPQLIGRDQELATLVAFCLAPEVRESGDDSELTPRRYMLLRAPAWAGKSALMSTFVLTPPAELRELVCIVSFLLPLDLPVTILEPRLRQC